MVGTLLDILVSVTALLMAVAPVDQIRKILRHRDSRNVSQTLFWVVALGTGSLALHSFYVHDLFIALPNSSACLINTFTALLARKYSHGDNRTAEQSK